MTLFLVTVVRKKTGRKDFTCGRGQQYTCKHGTIMDLEDVTSISSLSKILKKRKKILKT